MAQELTGKDLRYHLAAVEAKLFNVQEALANQIAITRTLRRANDALHYVWCNGGCDKGVHRYDDLGPDVITEELVQEAERNVARLRTYWTNRQFRQASASAEQTRKGI